MFVDLASTRQVGMAAQPITYAEMDAYGRLTGLPLLPWEVRTLRRLDDAVLPIMRDNAGRTGVSAKDTAGVRAIFAGIKARQHAKGGKG